MEEVALMEIFTMTRPSMLSTAACAPFAPLSASATPVAVLAAERAPAQTLAAAALAGLLAAGQAPISRVHQVQSQAELAQTLVPVGGINGTNGTTGFKGSDAAMKRYADGGSGVPPRGRPV
jgi:hypothetical protein